MGAGVKGYLIGCIQCLVAVPLSVVYHIVGCNGGAVQNKADLSVGHGGRNQVLNGVGTCLGNINRIIGPVASIYVVDVGSGTINTQRNKAIAVTTSCTGKAFSLNGNGATTAR